MEKEEKVVQRLWSDPEFKSALLISGLIFYVPIVNLLLFGYGSLFLQKLFRKEGLGIISWREGPAILRETIRIFPIILVYFISPLIIGVLLTIILQGFFSVLGLKIFTYTISFVPFSFLALIIPVLFFNALKRYLKRDDMKTSLLVLEIVHISLKQRRLWISPLLIFWGWVAITWPLVGFGFFAGLLPFLAVMVMKITESSKRT